MIFSRKHRFTKKEREEILGIKNILKKILWDNGGVIESWVNEYFKENYANFNEIIAFIDSISCMNKKPTNLKELNNFLEMFFLNEEQKDRCKLVMSITDSCDRVREIVNDYNITYEQILTIKEKWDENSSIDIGAFILACRKNKYTIEEIMWLLDKKIYMTLPSYVYIKDIEMLFDLGYQKEDIGIYRERDKHTIKKVVSKYSRKEALKLLNARIGSEVLCFYIDKEFTSSEIMHANSINPQYTVDNLDVIFNYKVKSKKEFIEKYC